MSSGYLHDQVLINGLARALAQLGAQVFREHRVGSGRRAGRVDLYAVHGGLRLAVEAELDIRRMPGDVRKARELRAHHLMILVPDWPLALRGARFLRSRRLLPSPDGMGISILTLGAARQHLANCFPLMTPALVPVSLIIKSPQPTPPTTL